MGALTEDFIRTAKILSLRPNEFFQKIDIPYLYQKRGILMMLMRKRMVLGDDVGLGKTLEAIVALSYLMEKDNTLKAVVFTEKSTLIQWKKEIAWLCENVGVEIVTAITHKDIPKRKEALRVAARILITTYSTVYRYLPDLLEGRGKRFVFFADECVYFKNAETLMFRQMRTLEQTAVRGYGMTATIVENKLEEAYSILRIVCPGVFPSRDYFDRKFCTYREEKGEIRARGGVRKKVVRRILVGYKNLGEFRRMIEPYVYGRLQTNPEVEQDIPEDYHKDMEVELSEEQSKKILEAQRGLIEMPDGEVKVIGILASMTLCQQLVDAPELKGFQVSSEKIETVIESLETSLKGERVVVWSKFRTEIDLMCKYLAEAGIDFVRITGKEDENEREVSKTRFMSDGPDRCNLLLMTKAGQRGLNLQKAGHLFFMNLPWSYGIYRQIVGRLKRTGSVHRRIGVYRLLGVLHPNAIRPGESDETIDHYTLQVLMRKWKLFSAVQGATESIEDTGETSDAMEIYRLIKESKRAA